MLEDELAERLNAVVGSDKFLLALKQHHAVEPPSMPAPKPPIAKIESHTLPPPKPAWFSIEDGPPRYTIRSVQYAVCKKYGIDRTKLLQRRRFKGIVVPRQMAMWLASEVTVHSMPEIGRRFGGFDHTTILAAVRKINRLIETDPAFAKLARELKEQFDGTANPRDLPADQAAVATAPDPSPALPGEHGEAQKHQANGIGVAA